MVRFRNHWEVDVTEDKTLYALALENNRMLRALSEQVGSKQEPENFRALRVEVHTLGSERRHVRDAALEEAAKNLDSCFFHGHLSVGGTVTQAQQYIRALKSKPATEHPSWCRHAPHHPGECEASKDKPVPETKCPIAKCSFSASHLGPCSHHTPEPLHDFGWALARMREGKAVARPDWIRMEAWKCVRDDDGKFWFRGTTQPFTPENVLATDWQVVE